MLQDIQVSGQKDTRSGFGDGILEAARENQDIVALTADLAGSMKLHPFIAEFPERYFQCGIGEANMISIAAGLTIGGKIPFTTTFANFSTGRVYDQIRQSVAYSGKNVKICASHAGLTLGEDGATHQILEDIGMMKMLPGMTVIVPCDYSQTKAATKAIANHVGQVYLRFGRPVWPIFTEGKSFTIGKAQVFSEGTDISIFACGHLVWKAIEAGKILGEKGISVEIINIHTIKPIDEAAVIASILKTKCAVTAEEHNIIGGLGDSIARIAACHFPIPIEYVGTNDTFGESGTPAQLLEKYGLTAPHIVSAAKKVIARKTLSRWKVKN
jgi:transketolase